MKLREICWNMRNFYHTDKFSTVTINFSEVWPRHILDLGKQFNLMMLFENILKSSLKTSSRCLENVFAIRLEDVFKASWQDVLKMSRRRLECVFETSWRCLEYVFARRVEDVLARRLEDEYIGLDQDVLKMSSEDVWVRRIHPSWSRRLLKTKRKDFFKMFSSRRTFAGMFQPQ